MYMGAWALILEDRKQSRGPLHSRVITTVLRTLDTSGAGICRKGEAVLKRRHASDRRAECGCSLSDRVKGFAALALLGDFGFFTNDQVPGTFYYMLTLGALLRNAYIQNTMFARADRARPGGPLNHPPHCTVASERDSTSGRFPELVLLYEPYEARSTWYMPARGQEQEQNHVCRWSPETANC